jgi:hypothetical protein
MNQQQELAMGMEGIELENTTWWKPDGTDHFTIRDVLMGPDGMVIRTLDGRQIDGSVMETYIQSDTPIAVPAERPKVNIDVKSLDTDSPVEQTQTQAQQKGFGSLRNSHPGVTFKEDTRHYGMPKDPLNDPLGGAPEQATDIDPVEYTMIDRVLGKASFDCIHVDVQDDGTIMNGISTLHDVLNVKRENIEAYLTQRIMASLKDIAKTACDQLLEVIPVKVPAEE